MVVEGNIKRNTGNTYNFQLILNGGSIKNH